MSEILLLMTQNIIFQIIFCWLQVQVFLFLSGVFLIFVTFIPVEGHSDDVAKLVRQVHF